MAKPTNPGTDLKADFVNLLIDETFHDVTIVCSDGVKIGASRNVLAARSAVFRAMLYGEMREAISGNVFLQDIKSDTLKIVLIFIYRGDIEVAFPLSSEALIQVYRAAAFLILPKLMTIVTKQAQEKGPMHDTVSLLNEAKATIPFDENSEELYNVLLELFCSRRLLPGDLNNLSADALDMLLEVSSSKRFQTPENILLLCIIEWAWHNNNKDGSLFDEYREILKAILIEEDPLHQTNKQTSLDSATLASLSLVIPHIQLRLICPHRLAHLMEAIEGLSEIIPQNLIFGLFSGMTSHCPPNHPSKCRGKAYNTWTGPTYGLVVSENGTVVEYPKAKDESTSQPKSVRTVAPVPLDIAIDKYPDIVEWDIVIESSGVDGNLSCDAVGVVGFKSDGLWPLKKDDDDWWSLGSSYMLRSDGFQTYLKSGAHYGQKNQFGRPFGTGDIITFHLNRKKRNCAISINGTDYDIAFRSVLGYLLFPCVTLYPQARYRLITRHDWYNLDSNYMTGIN